jgi:hypothetical protein
MLEGVITCIECKSEIHYFGQGTLEQFEKGLEKMGFRRINGGWMCLVCTGLLGDMDAIEEPHDLLP